MNHRLCKGNVMRGTSCLKDQNNTPTQPPKTSLGATYVLLGQNGKI